MWPSPENTFAKTAPVWLSFALILLTIQSCGLLTKFPPQPPLLQEKVIRIISEIQEQEEMVHSFYGSGRLTIKEGYWEQEAHLFAAATKEPRKIKIEITHSWGQPVVHMLIRGEMLAALSFSERKLYTGKMTREALSALFRGQFDPEMVWEVLRGYPILRPCHHPSSQRGNQITLWDDEGKEVETLDLDSENLQPRLVSFPDLATQLAFEGFQDDGKIRYAQEVKANHAQGLLILRNENRVFNKAIPEEIFTLEQTPGFEPVDLDTLEKGKRLF